MKAFTILLSVLGLINCSDNSTSGDGAGIYIGTNNGSIATTVVTEGPQDSTDQPVTAYLYKVAPRSDAPQGPASAQITGIDSLCASQNITNVSNFTFDNLYAGTYSIIISSGTEQIAEELDIPVTEESTTQVTITVNYTVIIDQSIHITGDYIDESTTIIYTTPDLSNSSAVAQAVSSNGAGSSAQPKAVEPVSSSGMVHDSSIMHSSSASDLVNSILSPSEMISSVQASSSEISFSSTILSSSQSSSSSIPLSSSSPSVAPPFVVGESIHDVRDGNTYTVVTIGTQTWMSQNLNYEPTNGTLYWPTYQSASTYDKNGKLYTWPAVMGIDSMYNDSLYSPLNVHQGICPAGWHVPVNSEWDTLINYVGAQGYAADVPGALKATTLWSKNNSRPESGSDAFGFQSYPTGGYSHGNYWNIYDDATYWTASETTDSTATYRVLPYSLTYVKLHTHCAKDHGQAVRCIRTN